MQGDLAEMMLNTLEAISPMVDDEPLFIRMMRRLPSEKRKREVARLKAWLLLVRGMNGNTEQTTSTHPGSSGFLNEPGPSSRTAPSASTHPSSNGFTNQPGPSSRFVPSAMICTSEENTSLGRSWVPDVPGPSTRTTAMVCTSEENTSLGRSCSSDVPGPSTRTTAMVCTSEENTSLGRSCSSDVPGPSTRTTAMVCTSEENTSLGRSCFPDVPGPSTRTTDNTITTPERIQSSDLAGPSVPGKFQCLKTEVDLPGPPCDGPQTMIVPVDPASILSRPSRSGFDKNESSDTPGVEPLDRPNRLLNVPNYIPCKKSKCLTCQISLKGTPTDCRRTVGCKSRNTILKLICREPGCSWDYITCSKMKLSNMVSALRVKLTPGNHALEHGHTFDICYYLQVLEHGNKNMTSETLKKRCSIHKMLDKNPGAPRRSKKSLDLKRTSEGYGGFQLQNNDSVREVSEITLKVEPPELVDMSEDITSPAHSMEWEQHHNIVGSDPANKRVNFKIEPEFSEVVDISEDNTSPPHSVGWEQPHNIAGSDPANKRGNFKCEPEFSELDDIFSEDTNSPPQSVGWKQSHNIVGSDAANKRKNIEPELSEVIVISDDDDDWSLESFIRSS